MKNSGNFVVYKKNEFLVNNFFILSHLYIDIAVYFRPTNGRVSYDELSFTNYVLMFYLRDDCQGMGP